MKTSLRSTAAALLTIAFGAAWFLNMLDAVPGASWVRTLGLGLIGLMILGFCGFNKLTIVTGPFLIVASVLSALLQTGRVSINQEMPILVIAFGALMLLSQLIPAPPAGYRNVQVRA